PRHETQHHHVACPIRPERSTMAKLLSGRLFGHDGGPILPDAFIVSVIQDGTPPSDSEDSEFTRIHWCSSRSRIWPRAASNTASHSPTFALSRRYNAAAQCGHGRASSCSKGRLKRIPLLGDRGMLQWVRMTEWMPSLRS